MESDSLDYYHEEYIKHFETILVKNGEKDGFIIDGRLWWVHYKDLIINILADINGGEFDLEKARDFYLRFGFAPKLYVNSYIDHGIERISSLYKFLADPTVPVRGKMNEAAENQESPYFIRGVGSNFVSLFLTVLYPQECAQWNMPIDNALKLLKVYPVKEKGESKGDFYLKINEVCRSIMAHYEFENLPQVDNFLFCIFKGYLSLERKDVESIEQDAEIIAKDEIITGIDTEVDPHTLEDTHTKMQYLLIKIGILKGYDVWVATNDKGKSYNNELFSNLCLDEIPQFTHPNTLAIAKLIDVIWFQKRTVTPLRFFEIEHSTQIFSGLLRLNDVKIDYPIGKAVIVIPDERVPASEKQIQRRTFNYSELSDICDLLTYSELNNWYQAVITDSKYH